MCDQALSKSQKNAHVDLENVNLSHWKMENNSCLKSSDAQPHLGYLGNNKCQEALLTGHISLINQCQKMTGMENEVIA